VPLRALWLVVCLACTGLAPAIVAAASPTVRIVDLDPAGSEMLRRGDALSVRLAYDSEIPLRFGVQGFARGERLANAQSNTVPVYPAGRGEAIVWLAFQESVYLDEIRVRMMDQAWQEQGVAAHPVSYFWDREPRSTPRRAAPWVAELNDAQSAMARAAAAAQAPEEGFDGWGLLILFMGWSVPGYIVLQVYALARWRAGWRTAALVPLLLMVPLVAYTLFALLAGSNLWPLMLIFLTPLAFIYLFAVGLLRLARPAH
jgi:hypothetical protein